MSDSTLRIWSRDPNFVPAAAQISQVIELFRRKFPLAAVEVCVFDEVTFIDCGSNLEVIACPLCGADLTDPWGTLMGIAHASGFTVLEIITPCCGKASSLADLRYQMQVGFGRFVIDVSMEMTDYGSPFAIAITDALGSYDRAWRRI